MKTSCVNHPTNEPLIVIRKWQVDFCKGNHCAAALMSFFEYWHNIKLEMSIKNKRLNEVAERHGDEACHDETLLQWHTNEQLSEGLLGLYGKNKIISAIKLLVELKVISIHENPNPRYAFDKTNFFLFHPENLPDSLEINDPSFKKGHGAFKKGHGAFKNKRPITEITTETTTEKETKEYIANSSEFAHSNGKKVFLEHVLLTEEEYDKLKQTFPDKYEKYIQALNDYIALIGKQKARKYKSHYHTILNWHRREQAEIERRIHVATALKEKEEEKYKW